ncbi:MAG: uridine kinase [Gaiellaceae bacterium]
MSDCLTKIIEAAGAKQPPKRMTTRIIAIDGAGGSGKSSLADRLADEWGGVPIVHTDDFASWDNPLDWWPRLIEDVLEPLLRGAKSIRYRRSVWDSAQPELWGEFPASEFLILEGVSASREAFRPFLTYSIWIETPRELRLRRGLERDGLEARTQWEEWMAEEDDYVRRERPQQHVDLVLPGDRDLWS